jgi:uncharacterized protein (DUF2336 family)
MNDATREVITQLIEETSWTERAKLVERLGSRFSAGGLASSERHAITDAFRVALFDSEPLVRRVLAESVKLARDLPRDILLSLARDTAAVAIPVLEHSPELRDIDLLPLVERGAPAHRFAIAGRKQISARVAQGLCRAGERAVLLRLLSNDGAALGETTLHELLDRFADHPEIAETIGRRRLLPVSIGARLFAAPTPREAPAATPALRLVWDRTGSLG